MNRKILALALAAATVGFAGTAVAEDSEKETPQEEQDVKPADMEIPDAVIEHLAYLEELEARYPDISKVDVSALVEQEGEKAALLYCKAIGFDGPCTINEEKGETEFTSVPAEQIASRSVKGRWWSWLNANNFGAVGVIAEDMACSTVPYAPRPMVQIHMDDEDRRNNNSRWGWLGATTSNRNTTWRYCRLESWVYSDFKPLAYGSRDADYAVLKLGALCPAGSRTITRRQDNEDWRNANWSSGNAYPNVNVHGRNWTTHYCHFDGGSYSPSGTMSAFPIVGFPYGVFASERMPRDYAMQYGFVYQDDEDFWNQNWWFPSNPNTAVMGGGSNTWRKLVKVR